MTPLLFQPRRQIFPALKKKKKKSQSVTADRVEWAAYLDPISRGAVAQADTGGERPRLARQVLAAAVLRDFKSLQGVFFFPHFFFLKSACEAQTCACGSHAPTPDDHARRVPDKSVDEFCGQAAEHPAVGVPTVLTLLKSRHGLM